jgi:hypothetical protein
MPALLPSSTICEPSSGLRTYYVCSYVRMFRLFGDNGDAWARTERPPRGKGELSNLDTKTAAVDRLQKVCSELAELHTELSESDIEPNALRLLRDTLDQMRKTTWTLQQGMERSHLSADKQRLWKLLVDERMRLASDLNLGISEDLEAGRIRTDQHELSSYMRVLNHVMEQLDFLFKSRKA